MDNWVSLAALAVSISVAVFGFVSRPTFVPAARAEEMRTQIHELHQKITELREENALLETRVKQLIGEVEFWRDEYRRRRGPNEP